jgi:MOSC domain-containing protein YiiM
MLTTAPGLPVSCYPPVSGRVASIQLCPGHREPMRPVASATLITGFGLNGDKHAQAASRRQVLLVDQEALDPLGLAPGTVKENLTVEGLQVMQLSPGTRLRVGPGAVLEITSICEPCFRMDEIRPGLRLQLEGRRGMNSLVVRGGAIAVGDAVIIDESDALAL